MEEVDTLDIIRTIQARIAHGTATLQESEVVVFYALAELVLTRLSERKSVKKT